MKKHGVIIAALLMLMMAFQATGRFPVFADRHSETEVRKFMEDVESELDEKRKKTGAENYASREIQRALEYIKTARKFMADNERDLAFYELKKAAAHNRLIDAKRRMVHAEIELDHAEKSKDK
jgi:hypothetical protein